LEIICGSLMRRFTSSGYTEKILQISCLNNKESPINCISEGRQMQIGVQNTIWMTLLYHWYVQDGLNLQ
jgi:hypothetical protein